MANNLAELFKTKGFLSAAEIDIKEGKKLQLKWELVDYQQSWMVLSE